MFEGPVTGNIPEVLDNGEVTDGTHVTAGQLALALTPYAQVTDLATTRPPSSPWTTESPQSWPQSSALAPAIAPLAMAAALVQQGRPVRRAGGRGGHQEHPGRCGREAVQLQHHGGHERLHRLGQQRTLATVAANYGLKTVVDQRSLDIAARITPLEVRGHHGGPTTWELLFAEADQDVFTTNQITLALVAYRSAADQNTATPPRSSWPVRRPRTGGGRTPGWLWRVSPWQLA